MVIYNRIMLHKIYMWLVRNYRTLIIIISPVVFILGYYAFVHDEKKVYLKTESNISQLSEAVKKYQVVLRRYKNGEFLFLKRDRFPIEKPFEILRNNFIKNDVRSISVTFESTNNREHLGFNMIAKGSYGKIINFLVKLAGVKFFMIKDYAITQDETNQENIVLSMHLVMKNEFN